jgi:methionyl-tRNA formyltransferase
MGPLDAIEPPGPPQPPGMVLEAHGDRLVIACGQGAVMPRTVQIAGKRPMNVAEFLRGHPVHLGDRFGPESS